MHIAIIEFRTRIEPYPVEIANALAQHCEVSLFLPADATPTFLERIDTSRVNYQPFHMPRRRQLANIGMVRELQHQFKQFQVDLVHITYWHLWATPGLGLFKQQPLVCTVHDVTRHPGERGIWAVPNALYPWQWRWADEIIVHATTSQQQLVNDFQQPADKIHIIPIGSYNLYQTTGDTTQPDPEQPHHILFFGRIWGYKGLQYLIEAEPLITKAIPDAKIVIAGHGEDFEKYEAMMVNPDHFEVHNYYIPNEVVNKLFQQAGVVVLPYIEASQSGVVPVAYSYGKPVVSTTVGGLPDVVVEGQTGFLVPPADAQALAEAIIKVIKDEPTRQQLGQNARHFAETDLSWQGIAEKTLKVYNKVLT